MRVYKQLITLKVIIRVAIERVLMYSKAVIIVLSLKRRREEFNIDDDVIVHINHI